MGCVFSCIKRGTPDSASASGSAANGAEDAISIELADLSAAALSAAAAPAAFDPRSIPMRNADERSWEAGHVAEHTAWAVYAARYVWGVYDWTTYVERVRGLLRDAPPYVLGRRIGLAWKLNMDALARHALVRPRDVDLVPLRADPHIDYARAQSILLADFGGSRPC